MWVRAFGVGVLLLMVVPGLAGGIEHPVIDWEHEEGEPVAREVAHDECASVQTTTPTEVCEGGACSTFNGGCTWVECPNQPVTEAECCSDSDGAMCVTIVGEALSLGLAADGASAPPVYEGWQSTIHCTSGTLVWVDGWGWCLYGWSAFIDGVYPYDAWRVLPLIED